MLAGRADGTTRQEASPLGSPDRRTCHRSGHRLRMKGRRKLPGTLLPPNAHSLLVFGRALTRGRGRPLASGRLIAALGAPRRRSRAARAPHTVGRRWQRKIREARGTARSRRPFDGKAIEQPRLRMEGRRRLPGTLLPPNAHSVCLPHPGWCSAPVHPQSVDDPSKGNVDASASARKTPENRGIAGAAAFVARKCLRLG